MTTTAVKAAAFRAIAHSRRSAKRFQTDRVIPREILKDILQSTIVRVIVFCFYFPDKDDPLDLLSVFGLKSLA